MLQTLTLGAGMPVEFNEPADFFRLLAASYPLNVTFYSAGREVARAESVSAGYSEKFRNSQFDRVRLESATGQQIQYVARLGNDVGYDAPPVGNVQITNMSGAFAQSVATVTNVSGQLLAANPGRRYLLIQNNDASGDIYVTLDGSAATVAGGVKIVAGGSLEIQGYCPVGAVEAIGSIASNANIVVVEG